MNSKENIIRQLVEEKEVALDTLESINKWIENNYMNDGEWIDYPPLIFKLMYDRVEKTLAMLGEVIK